MNGLKKVFELLNGSSGEYWVPTHAHIDFVGMKIEMRIELYYNKAAYEAGKAAMPQTESIVLDLPKAMVTQGNKLLPVIIAQKERGRGGEDRGKLVPGFFVDAVIDTEAPTPAPTPDPTPDP